MGILSPIKDSSKIEELSHRLSNLLIQVAADECDYLQGIWERKLDDVTQVLLFAEYAIFLVAGTDRLAFNHFEDPQRSRLMNLVVDDIRDAFSEQEYFGETVNERKVYFNRLFIERFNLYGTCSSIMGEGKDQLVFTSAHQIAENQLENY